MSASPKRPGKAEVISPAAKEFIERDLQFFSSHPYFARRKVRLLVNLPLWIPCLAGWLVVACLVWKGLHFDLKAIYNVSRGRNWFIILLGGVGIFAVTLAATWVLSLRASAAAALASGRGRRDQLSPQVLGVLLGGGVLSGLSFAFMPYCIPEALVSSVAAQQLAFIAAFIPYVLCLALFDFLSPGKSRSPLLLLVVLALLGAAVLLLGVSWRLEWATRLFSSRIIAEVPWLGPWLAQQTAAAAQGFARLLAVIVTLLMLVVLAEWTLSGIPEFKKKKPIALLGFFPRLRHALRQLWQRITGRSGGSTTPQSKDEKGEPNDETDWRAGLQQTLVERLGASHLASGEAAKDFDRGEAGPDRDDQPSPRASNRNKNILFGSLQPSQDQWDALEIFLQKSLGMKPLEGEGGTPPSPDLLLEGGNGVGKTTALMAAALQTLLIKGERAVIFAPDETSRRTIAATINAWLQAADFHYYLSAGEVTDASHRWIEQPEGFPDILVASPFMWEKLFFGESCDVASMGKGNDVVAPRDQLRCRLLSFTSFFIDDIASPLWSVRDLTHLPFLIDKQRLLLAAGGRWLQVMATRATIEEEEAMAVGNGASRSPIRDTLVKRLFGGNEDPVLRRHYIPIRTWQSAVPERLDIHCKPNRSTEVMFFVIREALRADKQVVAYVPDLGGAQPEDVRKDFMSRMQSFWAQVPSIASEEAVSPQESVLSEGDSEGTSDVLDLSDVALVCHINEPRNAALQDERERLIIYDGSCLDNIAPQLYSRYSGDSGTAIIALRTERPSAGLSQPNQVIRYPLLVAREAIPVLCAHLRSAAVHLESGQPFSRDHLSAAGVAPAGHVPSAQAWMLENWRPSPEMTFLVDPPDPLDSSRGPDEGGGMREGVCCFAPADSGERKTVVPSAPIRPNDLLDFGWAYHLGPERTAIRFGRLDDKHQESRRAVWLDERRVTISISDLAFADDISVVRGQQRFWGLKLTRSASGQLMLQGATSHGLPTQPTVPYWRLRLAPRFENIDPKADKPDAVSGDVVKGGVLGLEGPWEGTSADVQVTELFLTHRSLHKEGRPVDSSTSQIPGFVAHVAIDGVMPAQTRVRGMGYGEPAEFAYPAAVTAVFIGMSFSDPKKVREELAAISAREWSSETRSGEWAAWPELALALQTGLRNFSPRFTHYCRLVAFARRGRGVRGRAGGVVFFIEPSGTAGTIKPLLRTLLTYPELADKEVIQPALAALEGSNWTGPGFSDETAFSRPAAERLLRQFGGAILAQQPDEKPDRILPTVLAPVSGLPELPFKEGRLYACGKCSDRFTVPVSKNGHSVCKCGAQLWYVAETVSKGTGYSMQFLTGAKWPNAASCPKPAGSAARVEAMWLDVAERVAYQKDEETFAGREEVWQTSEETLRCGVGDCEDHSILLVDWLISEGYDARVAIGESSLEDGKWGGHAWVVLRLEGREYLIDATRNVVAEDHETAESKALRRARREHLKLEGIETKAASYRPAGMFDRGRYWMRKGFASGKNIPSPKSYWSGEEEWIEGMWLRSVS